MNAAWGAWEFAVPRQPFDRGDPLPSRTSANGQALQDANLPSDMHGARSALAGISASSRGPGQRQFFTQRIKKRHVWLDHHRAGLTVHGHAHMHALAHFPDPFTAGTMKSCDRARAQLRIEFKQASAADFSAEGGDCRLQ